eukprot:scaffold11967_cov94-Skeletonema_dohrnii-CCMP3373.AAC.1
MPTNVRVWFVPDRAPIEIPSESANCALACSKMIMLCYRRLNRKKAHIPRTYTRKIQLLPPTTA